MRDEWKTVVEGIIHEKGYCLCKGCRGKVIIDEECGIGGAVENECYYCPCGFRCSPIDGKYVTGDKPLEMPLLDKRGEELLVRMVFGNLVSFLEQSAEEWHEMLRDTLDKLKEWGINDIKEYNQTERYYENLCNEGFSRDQAVQFASYYLRKYTSGMLCLNDEGTLVLYQHNWLESDND